MSNTPVFGTKEWAPQSANIIEGCSNNCKYCYAREMAIRFGRKTPENWEKEIFRNDWSLKKYSPKKGRIMFPSTHDITPNNVEHSLSFLSRILQQGNQVLIVTKPNFSCVKEICDTLIPYNDQIMFRFSIGSMNDMVLRSWEPGASFFKERLESVQYAYLKGYSTSISCEPMLDNQPEDLIESLLPYVTDSIWLGKPNFLLRRVRMNGYSDLITTSNAKNLMDALSDDFIIRLYEKYGDHPKIKWKESIKKVLNIAIPTEAGLDQ